MGIRAKVQKKGETMIQQAADKYGMDVDIDKLSDSLGNAFGPLFEQLMSQAEQVQDSPDAARIKQNANQAVNQGKTVFKKNKNKKVKDFYEMFEGALVAQIENIDNKELQNIAKEAFRVGDKELKKQFGDKGNVQLGQVAQNVQKQV